MQIVCINYMGCVGVVVCVSNADVLAEEKSRQVESLTVSVLIVIIMSLLYTTILQLHLQSITVSIL